MTCSSLWWNRWTNSTTTKTSFLQKSGIAKYGLISFIFHFILHATIGGRLHHLHRYPNAGVTDDYGCSMYNYRCILPHQIADKFAMMSLFRSCICEILHYIIFHLGLELAECHFLCQSHMIYVTIHSVGIKPLIKRRWISNIMFNIRDFL